LEYKKKAVNLAKKTSNTEASKILGIPCCNISRWQLGRDCNKSFKTVLRKIKIPSPIEDNLTPDKDITTPSKKGFFNDFSVAKKPIKNVTIEQVEELNIEISILRSNLRHISEENDLFKKIMKILITKQEK
jgi:hypothetical protein